MAIDTQNKRRSAQQGAAGTPRPVADGTIDTADRAAAAWFYAGTTYGEPPPAPVGPPQQQPLFLINVNRLLSR